MSNRILIVTDAWDPQINGVVSTLKNTIKELKKMNFEVLVIHPNLFKTFTISLYPEIQIPYKHKKKVVNFIESFNPNYIHIATEGILGITARKYCLDKKLKFTTAYHTKFPEYASENFNIPVKIGYFYMKWFHKKSSNILVPTKSVQKEIKQYGIKKTKIWSRGVDIDLFNPNKKSNDFDFQYALYVGRVSKEKNLEDFLALDLKNIGLDLKKIVVGDGNKLESYRKKHKDVLFVGSKNGEDLAKYYANAEVFCFPSKTDTFGLVIIESLASGVPVVSYKVPQIMDIVNDSVGATSDNLIDGIKYALKNKNSKTCRQYVVDNYSWKSATDVFVKLLVPTK
jgi:glycosyltransferase involved in cell wall biosynthesis